MKYVLIAAVLVVAALIYSTSRKPEGSIGAVSPSADCSIDAYGNGVYYFDCTTSFGKALAEFSKSHQIVAISTDVRLQNSVGYWVVTSK